MNSISRAKKYQEKRDKEIAKKLETVLKFIEREQIKQDVYRKIFNKYRPTISKISNEMRGEIYDEVAETIRSQIKDIVKELTFAHFEDEIEEEVRNQISDKLRILVDD